MLRAVLIVMLEVLAVCVARPQHHNAVSHSSVTLHHVPHPAPTLHVAPVAKLAPVVHAPVVHAPVHHVATVPVTKHVEVEHYAPPHYEFEYSVHDPHTGDVKEQKESRKDDKVHGFYSLVEPDGSKRIVEYTADHHNGFNAVVHREPSKHPVTPVKKVTPVKTVAPVKEVAPVAVKYTAPVAVKYTTPVAVKHTVPAITYTLHHHH